MKASEFKTLIKEATREVVREELESFFSSKFGGNGSSNFTTDIIREQRQTPKPEFLKNYKESLTENMNAQFRKPKVELPFQQQEIPGGDMVNMMLQETARELTYIDRNAYGIGEVE